MKLYVISDTHIQKRYSHLDLAKFAKEAEVDYFQYREKFFDYSIHYQELLDIRETLRGSKTQLIINDNLELALKVHADGVHVGQEDISLQKIFERALPSGFIVGATVHNVKELQEAEKFPVHYIGVGPVFGTNSKKMQIPALGIEGLKNIKSRTSLPIYAIGNIQIFNYREVISLGIEGIVLLSAFVLSENPVNALKQFRNI
ncbi:MAG: thiamine-phosphate synthase [Bacteroidia bacterium]|nr:MAG: thiamine-phosphate synthase [Bacteroidia bacterium]